MITLLRASLFTSCLLLIRSPAWSQLEEGSLNVQWNEGAQDCTTSNQPPIQVHAYNARTYILRQNLCATFEAPFIYLLIGSEQALLIDTGALEDLEGMPLADTVLGLLPSVDAGKLPLLVLHSHRHQDHRAGDAQFANRPGVQVVPALIEDVLKYFGFKDWPNEKGVIELGGRTVDVLPTPGHNPTHLAYYDRNTGLLLTGDFLLPGRLLVDDTDAYLASAIRVVEFVKAHPVTHVLGAHIEMNLEDELFPWQSTHHPNERALPLTKEDALVLPGAVRSFNGISSKYGKFAMSNPNRILMALGGGVLAGLIFLALLVRAYLRRRRARRTLITS